jgi:hypothetical protein
MAKFYGRPHNNLGREELSGVFQEGETGRRKTGHNRAKLSSDNE